MEQICYLCSVEKPKCIEIMKYKQLMAELTAAGCYLVRKGGNHQIWYSPITDKRFPLPFHGSKEVPPSTEKKIRKEAGV